MVLESAGTRIDFHTLVEKLGKRGLTSLLIEGGGEVAASALAAGIVDKVIFFIAPKIIGGREAPTAVSGAGAKDNFMVEGYLPHPEE
jgi:diaminohydroxyphosphoribosylaminopyrimidine deaminase/5-amino-6-(5-phosphoribosylamino)uracil reductase